MTNQSTPIIDFSSYAESEAETPTTHQLHLVIEGMECASCAWQIEHALNDAEVSARVNLSTQRLSLRWSGEKERGNALIAKAMQLGFRFSPYESDVKGDKEQKFLVKCIAIAGFASGNIMLFSYALWFSTQAEMGMATRDLFHWVSALIALPAILYSGRPFFSSAWNALRHFRTNMDVPISVAVLLASATSLSETLRHGEYVYFDSAIMLVFLLLIGRYFDKKARGRAKAAAQNLLAMLQGVATIRENGKLRTMPIRDIVPDMVLIAAAGEKIAADGIVISGVSEIDKSLLTGETLPEACEKGQKLYAGMINMTAPLELKVVANSKDSLLSDIIKLMENAEQSQAKYVRIADKVAEYYTPLVHLLAALAFVFWLSHGVVWQQALMIATTVLIITCPCALGLAVPVVQVVASGALFRKGMMLKSGDALERLAGIDTVIFDKTGTLTMGQPTLREQDTKDLQLAASLASRSRHPLSQAIAASWKGELLDLLVEEESGNGLTSLYQGKVVRLGRRGWCGDAQAPQDDYLELWLHQEGKAPVRFTFSDSLREDAASTVATLQQQGLSVILLSGDRKAVVASTANTLGITHYEAEISPADKHDFIKHLLEQGKKVLMVGDGLNDAPALCLATVSISPATGMDITQNAADMVFQGKKLGIILDALRIAHLSMGLVKQNFAISFLYNIIAIPVALMGMVTPLMAAVAMSSSSLLVIVNALRLNRK